MHLLINSLLPIGVLGINLSFSFYVAYTPYSLNTYHVYLYRVYVLMFVSVQQLHVTWI